MLIAVNTSLLHRLPALLWIGLTGCAADGLSLADPTVRRAQVNPSVISLQQSEHTLDVTINLSDEERDAIRFVALGERNLEELGLQLSSVQFYFGESSVDFSMNVQVLPSASAFSEPRTIWLEVDTADGHQFNLQGQVTLLSL